ncbi:hypothetical protein K7X08_029796 [Anisodus acutangulus]|uniref:GOST seven transmembrane domain-containing protein n=1 Tax=Anisodus acutangulus TaxID=402998 RepID=A0A9Q1MDS2_9SOLA|nr:hypothetical protein K7X08_029796 [Anisodus acutangulus]
MSSFNFIVASAVVVLLCLLCSLHFSNASVHDYSAEKFASKGKVFVVHGGSEGIYSSALNLNESSSLSSNGHSFIRFKKIIFRRPEEFSNISSGSIHAVVFEVDDRETIGGSAYGGQRAVCCTADLAKLGVCKQGEIIHRPSSNNPGWPKVFGVSFGIDELEAKLQPRTIHVTKTGMYNVYFMHCDPNLKEVVVEGKTVWKNPTGYLPGRMAPLMNFYGYMSLAFALLGIFWFSQYARFWREVIALQNCITLVITLGMFEMALWYFDYAEFNETGVRPTGITIWAVTFSTVKRTVSRLIILIVSMGYGVVRPTLGGLTSKVLLLGGTFFVASQVLELVENVGTVSDFSGKARLFFVLPVAILDAFFILWIFTSLSATLNKLQARRLLAKLDIYRRFTNSLAVAVIVSVGWVCYELYFKSTDVYNERWQNAWIIPAFWQVLSFSLLCIICALWAPSQNSMRMSSSKTNPKDKGKGPAKPQDDYRQTVLGNLNFRPITAHETPTLERLYFGKNNLVSFPSSNLTFKTLPDYVLDRQQKCLIDNLWIAHSRKDTSHFVATLNCTSHYFNDKKFRQKI